MWYRSPITGNDMTPSFQVSIDGKAFHDWSSGMSGSIIDLVKALGYAQNVKEALIVLGCALPPKTEHLIAIEK